MVKKTLEKNKRGLWAGVPGRGAEKWNKMVSESLEEMAVKKILKKDKMWLRFIWGKQFSVKLNS